MKQVYKQWNIEKKYESCGIRCLLSSFCIRIEALGFKIKAKLSK